MFKNDKINGKGIYTWANKIGYEGQFKNNKVEKNGILKYIEDNIIFKNKENINSALNKKDDIDNNENEEKNEDKEEDIKNEK